MKILMIMICSVTYVIPYLALAESKQDNNRMYTSARLISLCETVRYSPQSRCVGYLDAVLDFIDSDVHWPMIKKDDETVVKKLTGDIICPTIPITVLLLVQLIQAYYKSDDLSETASRKPLILVLETLAKAFPCQREIG